MRLRTKLLITFLVIVSSAAALHWWREGERILQASQLGWYQLPRHETSVLPDPTRTPEAIVAVLAAPTFGWRGYFAMHPWIVYKRANDKTYTRYEVLGWSATDLVRRNHAAPDGQWYGASPELLVIHTGTRAEKLIPGIEEAIANYPYDQWYRTYPGPNSNTFVAHIGREVPELKLDLPSNAIGKDYRPWHSPLGLSSSGLGLQASLGGFIGLSIGLEEGLEMNLFGLKIGLDLNCPALRLPFVGRLGLDGTLSAGCTWQPQKGVENEHRHDSCN
jgi:hypothetical protein